MGTRESRACAGRGLGGAGRGLCLEAAREPSGRGGATGDPGLDLRSGPSASGPYLSTWLNTLREVELCGPVLQATPGTLPAEIG